MSWRGCVNYLKLKSSDLIKILTYNLHSEWTAFVLDLLPATVCRPSCPDDPLLLIFQRGKKRDIRVHSNFV